MEIWSVDSTQPLASARASLTGDGFIGKRRSVQLAFSLWALATAGVARRLAWLFVRAEAEQLSFILAEWVRPERELIGGQVLIDALLAAEDHRYYFHGGVDPVAIIRATFHCLVGDTQGASTIEQQLVRVVTGNYRRTLRRKIKEILLASTVRDTLGKRSTIAAYMDIAYFGVDLIGHCEIMKTLSRDRSSLCFSIAHLKYPARKTIGETSWDCRRIKRAAHIEWRIPRVSHWWR